MGVAADIIGRIKDAKRHADEASNAQHAATTSQVPDTSTVPDVQEQDFGKIARDAYRGIKGRKPKKVKVPVPVWCPSCNGVVWV